MKKLYFVFTLLGMAFQLFSQQTVVNHKLSVKISPSDSYLEVIDTISSFGDGDVVFQLNSRFVPELISPEGEMKLISGGNNAGDLGMDRESDLDKVQLNTWKVTGISKYFVVKYEASLASEIKKSKENYQRGFSTSPGLINNLGVYLAGSTWWVPVFENSLMTYSLQTELPSDWRTVTTGKRNLNLTENEKHIDRWVCDTPQEEIFLIAAAFNEYSYNMNNGVKAMAFLRTPDESLANKYLEVTEQYLDMYESMLGDYPYSKFALVENFWETGYGMPSFTLLGEKIIRFPFILHSSYPHELLHNWWGNSVYVDFESGNWCEGLTVFMADHLIKEQRGQGEEYRRSTLQKYTNMVNPENDFPLNKFLSRHDGASEAIGYGKSMMMWQMLRREIGDDKFIEGVNLFNKKYKFKTASFDDIRKSMEEVSGEDLKWFFTQWVDRKGAPELEIGELVDIVQQGGSHNGYTLGVTVKQIQNDDVFVINLPINILTEKGLETFVVKMNKKEQLFTFNLKSKPLEIALDPQYDVFRILNPAEVPPTLSKIWASEKNVFILPAKADEDKYALYKKYAEAWKSADNDEFEILDDKDIKDLPKDKTAWILGAENKFADNIKENISQYGAKFNADSVFFSDSQSVSSNHGIILTIARKTDINRQDVFISIENEASINGLIRKLPHYGKYSFLAFSGDEPTNIAKGQWPVVNSPLVRKLSDEKYEGKRIEKRQALAYLKPVFSSKRMMETIEFLASDKLKGRGLGTPEMDEAADYIANKFKQAGLISAGGNYFQEFTQNIPEKGNLKMKNVIGIIPGNDAELKNEVVVLSAHYDHLGLGWPDHHQGDEGKIHNGADDNASGVAILIELARSMAKTAKPARTIVFIAMSGEEAGLLGSRYFVQHAEKQYGWSFFANVNMDTDGSLFDKKLMVLNANTAREWKFIFMGTDYTTGVLSQVIEKDLDASDQVAFIERQIPAVQLFTGATGNYHRPSDDVKYIDDKGLVKVATVAKEVVIYLGDRKDAMPFTGKNAKERPAEKPKTSGRRVSTGTVPDFAFKGEGVKVGSVIPGSAGEAAGLQKGDIIKKLDGSDTKDLRTYSNLLKNYQPGDEVELTVLRGEESKVLKIILGAR